MKTGEQFEVTHTDLVQGLAGRVVELEMSGGEKATARVVAIHSDGTATLKVVPERTKE